MVYSSDLGRSVPTKTHVPSWTKDPDADFVFLLPAFLNVFESFEHVSCSLLVLMCFQDKASASVFCW